MVISKFIAALIVFDTILFSILFFMRIHEKIKNRKTNKK